MSYETVTTSRAKRSTAGNRLRELLERAHAIDAEEGFEELPDDADFEEKPDVADVFEEDFESTDDERDTRDEEEDEDRVLEKEERAARRAEKQKGRHYHNPLAAPRSTAVAGTGGPSATARPKSAIRRVIESADDASDGPSRKKRRVSVVAPGEDGANQHNGGDSRGDGDEAGDNAGDGEADAPARRFHVRASTVKNKLDVDDRLREQKERTETLYASRRKPRSAIRRLTQAELVASALETEQHNLEALRTWLEEEEERKRVNKVARKVVAGPRVSWVSRRVDPEVKRRRRDKSKDKEQAGTQGDELGGLGQGDVTPGAEVGPWPIIEVIGEAPDASALASSASAVPNAATTAIANGLPDPAAYDPTAPYERNYLILSSIHGQAAELRAIFGSHADWTKLRRIPSNKRPAQRKATLCPFTGRPAKYRHPASMVPYATVEGYRLIEETLRHDYLWAEERMCFLGQTLEGDQPLEKAEGMEGIQGWDDAARGWWTFLEPEAVPTQAAIEEVPVVFEAAEEVPVAQVASTKVSKSKSSKKRRR